MPAAKPQSVMPSGRVPKMAASGGQCTAATCRTGSTQASEIQSSQFQKKAPLKALPGLRPRVEDVE